MLFHSQLLKQYINHTSKSWDKEIYGSEQYQRLLFRSLGDGILSFLREQIEDDKQLLCKTPRANNIDNFSLLFPQAKLLVLIRDGRDVVASAVKTWPDRFFAFERSALTWARGARLMQNFMDSKDKELRGKSWELVRYEDLVQCPENVMRKILLFLGIDANKFDFERMKNLGLRGSSVHHGEMDTVHWEPVEKPKNFQPIGRWKSWNPRRKTIFKVIAGGELIRSSYVDSNNW